jgi:hypothetical protein
MAGSTAALLTVDEGDQVPALKIAPHVAYLWNSIIEGDV